MSSSNQAKICIIKETTYGVLQGSGNFSTMRYKSEALTGTPQLVESATIRPDRMGSGQTVVGFKVGGAITMELSKDSITDMLITSAMKQDWNTGSPVTVNLSYDATAKTFTLASGTWPTNIVGKVITTTGFVSGTGVNNNSFFVSIRTSGTVIAVVPKSGISFVTEVGTGTAYTIADYSEIGATDISFDAEKIFNDLTTKATNYKGLLVSDMMIDAAYGKICEAIFTLVGNAQGVATIATDMITNGRTLNIPPTSPFFNGSIDMPVFALQDSTFVSSTMVVESIKLTLNNNELAKTGIGQAAPIGYDAGKAAINIEIVAYLDNVSWNMLAKRTNQTPFQVGFMLSNSGGTYAFYLPQVQASFDDPLSTGTDQQIKLNLKGVAKVGSTGESALTISRI